MSITIRQIEDAAPMMRWRREVIREVFGIEPDSELLEANLQYLREAPYIACVASEDGNDVGCGLFCLQREMPSPDNPTGRCACLMNIYVRTPYRRRGAGSEIVSWLIDQAKARGCGKIYLETTEIGRAVYSRLGFKDIHGMMILAE